MTVVSLEDLASRLQADEALLDRGEDIGDSGLVAPRINGSQDKRDGSARALARRLFPSGDAERQSSYIRYGQLIARLRGAFLAQEEIRRSDQEASANPFRQARLAGNRPLFDKLQGVAPSLAITKPTPMPVTVAPEHELVQVFSHLRTGTATELDIEQFERGALYRDGRIDMCKQVVGPPHVEDLAAAVAANPHVRHFLIGNNIVGDTGAGKIAEMVSARAGEDPIETLYLAGNEFTARGAEALASSLRSDSGVTSLWLKRNPLGPEGVGCLADMLTENTTLQVLDLVNTAAGDDGVTTLFEALRYNTNLQVLYLDANAVSATGAAAIADYFRFLNDENRTGLTGLYLGINRIEDTGAVDIADAITEYGALTRLDLGSNRIQTEGLSALLDAAATLPELLFLGLGLYKSTSDMGELPNYFDADGVDLISNYLRNHHNVATLDLKDTNLRPDGWPDLVAALADNPAIVDLAYTQFGLTLPREVHDGINSLLERNVNARFGESLSEFRNGRLRYLKHPQLVKNIDSIYRNAM